MKKRPSRSQVLILVTAAAALVVGAFFIWRWEPEHARAALRRAGDLKVVEFDLGPVIRAAYGTYDNRLLFRTTSPGSDRLLFKAKNNSAVLEYDAARGSLLPTQSSSWDSASGEINDEGQRLDSDSGWVSQGGRLLHYGTPAATVARNHMHAVSSPAHDKIAVVSADGRYTPGTYGMIFGGRPARASGRYYVEIIRASDGRRLTEPVALPRPAGAFWSADERFIVCRMDYTKYCVVPTGLAPTFPLRSGEDAREAKYGLYSLGIVDDDIHKAALMIRYTGEDKRQAIFYFTTHEPAFYRYDLEGRSLTTASRADWEAALIPARVGEYSQELTQKVQAKAATSDRWGMHMILLAAQSKALIASMKLSRTDEFYLQLYRLPEAEPIGQELTLGVRMVDSEYRGRDASSPYPVALAPDQRFVVYLNRDRRAVCIVHTDFAE